MTIKLPISRRVEATLQTYPRQFWLLFTGMLISTVGTSMIWPFLMIYVTEKLNLPLSIATSLNSINSAAMMISVFVSGQLVDRLGRRWAMIISLALNGVVYFLQGQASSYLAFALVMALAGAANPLYRVAADAMVTDLLPPDKRVSGFSLMRMSSNLGISIGPAIGGFINSSSYGLAFYLAAGGMIIYSLLMFFFSHETLPDEAPTPEMPVAREGPGGYGRVLKDRQFMAFIGIFTMVQFCAAMVWILLSVYAKHQYGVNENLYGWIPTTNALMVVLLQLSVTNITRRFSALPVMAFGACFYALATASIGLGQGFWAFWMSMVVMTTGELMIMPTASTFIANIAPTNMRGRYMSFFTLSWGIAAGLAPFIGGNLGDAFGPRVTWFTAAGVGTAAALGFAILAARKRAALRKMRAKVG